jgi:hypothetical protein
MKVHFLWTLSHIKKFLFSEPENITYPKIHHIFVDTYDFILECFLVNGGIIGIPLSPPECPPYTPRYVSGIVIPLG